MRRFPFILLIVVVSCANSLYALERSPSEQLKAIVGAVGKLQVCRISRIIGQEKYPVPIPVGATFTQQQYINQTKPNSTMKPDPVNFGIVVAALETHTLPPGKSGCVTTKAKIIENPEHHRLLKGWYFVASGPFSIEGVKDWPPMAALEAVTVTDFQ